MSPRRFLPLAVGVVALLALAGLASHGRPLTHSRGSGPSAQFFDYVFTTIVLGSLAVLVVVAAAIRGAHWNKASATRRRWYVVSTVLMLLATSAVAWLLVHTGFAQRLRHEVAAVPKGQRASTHPVPQPGKDVRGARLRWDEVAVVAALLAGAVGLAFATRAAKRPLRPWNLRSHEAVSIAVDESLDDLRTERDLRRAIIAAYARMERALAAAGLPRRPAEAPLEYLARALQNLDTSVDSVKRLTDLFEWAKFSHHAPDPTMRDEAIDALVAVRDELRRPEDAVA